MGMRSNLHLFWGVLTLGLVFSLGCSIGSLIVQAPTPTPTRYKTPRPTYTFTPEWTATFTPSPTATDTPTPAPTPTVTPTPSETPEGGEAAVEPVAQQPPPPPAEPTATPTPEPPTATPTPEFPFQVVYYVHDTGSPGETRMTAWIRRDSGPGLFKTLSGFQVKALAPDGNTYLSEMSGTGPGDSTVKGTGDNHNMNTKLEFRPYTPGDYTIYLVEGGVQVSPEIKLTLSAEPRQYVHFDFFKSAEDE
jgi:hypothetical protein